MKKCILIILVFHTVVSSGQRTRGIAPTERVYVEAGAYVPLDGLKDKMASSVNFGFWYQGFKDQREAFEVGLNLTAPESTSNFEYIHKDSVFNNRIRGLGGTIGVRYSARMDLFEGETTGIEWFSTLGYGFLTYRSQFVALADSAEPVVKEDFSKVFSTVSLGLGVRYYYKNVGVQASYQWTPYAIFYKQLPSDFGSGALLVSVIYKQ